MTTQAATTTATASVVVDAPQQRAFTAFTSEMANWWPPDHHILRGELAEMVLEPKEGGRIFDRATDGTECQWATVVAYEPPERFVFTWDVSLAWEAETDRARVSEVEVRFVADGPGRTRVELEHRNLDRHGDGWEAMRDAVGSEGGWMRGLLRLQEYVA